MNEKFIWAPDEDQSYSHENGSQAINPINSFNKYPGFTFKMDAGENTLTLCFNENEIDKLDYYNIHWPNSQLTITENTDRIIGEIIKISSGNFKINGNKEKPVNFYLNSEVFNKYRIKLQNSSTFEIMKANIVRIAGPQKPEESAVTMSGNSRLTIDAQENKELEGSISLNCYFSITESSTAMLKSHRIHIDGGSIILQDNAQVFINSPVLEIKTNLDEKAHTSSNTNFTLKAGATSLNLNSPDGKHFPLDIHREDYPKGVFNFMAEGKENIGKVVIDVAPKDANAYGLNTMLRKNFTAINGTMVETGDQMKYFDFSYGQDTRNGNQVGTITISLRNPLLKLS
ncbi:MULTISPECIES: hypothetical protein [Photorhabdus]|uniref:Uncharacterized protein n=2 Tax=Photorhabdus asymbiotica TaxID=291112 RepID=B6VK64_PHOAA|nr:hypothetical protein [Photorhabdus asymbiotica]RKS66915.1 hypothetical protein BDD30_1263 [Photorhabdus asymbiotica]CAQ83114.1 conserved hypothetical protein [Photorhabdus asymbiotica]CAR66544.1 Conserved Hypothetical Protein [Photorhabdus asymbiotica subsp. asymbiotica ATCC 43949]